MRGWSEENILLLKELYPNGEKKDLCKIFNKRWQTISEYARRMGIHRTYQETHRIWDEEKLDLLMNGYSSMDWKFLLLKLGISKENIQSKAYSLGLKRNVFCWDKNKEEILKKCFATYPEEKLCEMLGNTSWQAIRAHAERMGLKRDIKIHWTDDKKDFLKKYYYDASWNFLCSELGTTNRSIIRNQAEKLDLKRKRNFSKEEDDYLKEHYIKLSIKELSDFLGRSYNSIKTRLSRLSLRNIIDWEKFSEKELLDMLKQLSEELKRTPGIRELTSHGLPSSAVYKKHFGSYTNACDLVKIKTDSLYGNRCFSKNGDVCLSNCEAVVTDYLIDNDIKYKKDEYYSNYIDIKSRKTVDWVLLLDKTFVEFFGLPNKSYYKKKMEEKRELCKNNNINLIEIFTKDLRDLDSIFSNYINKNN